MPIWAQWIAAISLAFSATGLLISRSWRWSLGLLALQFFAAFWLSLVHWPLNMAATILVSGWMSVAALGITCLNLNDIPAEETSWPQGSTFRFFACGLVILAISASAGNLADWLPNASLPLAWGVLVLIGMGFLHLGMTLDPLRVIIGISTSLLGFEVMYTFIENSVLVAGLLALVSLCLAFTGCFLLNQGENFA